MLVKAVGEVLEPQPVLQNPYPAFQRKLFLARRYQLARAKPRTWSWLAGVLLSPCSKAIRRQAPFEVVVAAVRPRKLSPGLAKDGPTDGWR